VRSLAIRWWFDSREQFADGIEFRRRGVEIARKRIRTSIDGL
jgi:hypothetical protein